MFWTCLLFLAYGLIVFPSSVKTQDLTRTCSYAGVFHIEQRGRYFLTYPEAEKLCLSMGTVLASREDVNRAYSKGFETCRYGWIQNISVAIIRQQAHDRCAANSTGVLVLSANLTVRYDAYCYNSSDSSDKNCDLALVTIPHPLEKSEDGVDSFPPTGKPTPTPDKAEDETERSPGGEEKPTATTTENPQEERPQVRTTMDPAESKGITVPLPSDDETTTPANSSGIIPLVNDGFQHEKEKGENISDNSTTEIDLKPGFENRTDAASSDWLIILAVVVAVVVIFLVCIAIATRHRWCGKKQKLVITSKPGRDGNGAAGSTKADREQEMVQLMNKEKIQENGGNAEEFTVIALEDSPEKS
ncbi:CD44 protein, partial [Atractosteus spatula]|nr:CD44 protein [Atractosteus spatula]